MEQLPLPPAHLKGCTTSELIWSLDTYAKPACGTAPLREGSGPCRATKGLKAAAFPCRQHSGCRSTGQSQQAMRCCQGLAQRIGCRGSKEAARRLCLLGVLSRTCRYTRRVATRSGTCSKGTCSGRTGSKAAQNQGRSARGDIHKHPTQMRLSSAPQVRSAAAAQPTTTTRSGSPPPTKSPSSPFVNPHPPCNTNPRPPRYGPPRQLAAPRRSYAAPAPAAHSPP